MSFWAASGTQRRSTSVRLRLRPTHTATLKNEIVLRTATVSNCRVFDCGLDAGDRGKRLRHLGPSGTTLGRCHGSVEAAVDSAVSSVRERVWKCEARGQGRERGHGEGAESLELVGEGKGRPLTRVRRVKTSSDCSSFAPEASWQPSTAVRQRVRSSKALVARSGARVPAATIGIDQREGERERLRWCC
jgi:hypothetical protein